MVDRTMPISVHIEVYSGIARFSLRYSNAFELNNSINHGKITVFSVQGAP